MTDPFQRKKQYILANLALDSPDASPKGFVDEEILPLVEELNTHKGIVTTSSCAGRIAVFLEGVKSKHELNSERATSAAAGLEETPGEFEPHHDQHGLEFSIVTEPHLKQDAPRVSGIGGKGHGGQWIFVSHTAVKDNIISWEALGNNIPDCSFGVGSFNKESRLLHFKFEPMILHLMTDTLELAHQILKAALLSGFRESGIMNPVVPVTLAIRTTGLAFDSVIGHYDTSRQVVCPMVNDDCLKILSMVAESRFVENDRRRRLFLESVRLLAKDRSVSLSNWEDAETRKNRKRIEGLALKSELQALKEGQSFTMGTQERDESEILGFDQILTL